MCPLWKVHFLENIQAVIKGGRKEGGRKKGRKEGIKEGRNKGRKE